MSDAIGGFTGKPLVAGKCNLCDNEGTGNLGLFLCDSHIAVIIKEHGDGLNQRWHKEFRTTLLSQLREEVEEKIARATETQKERKSRGRDTIVQDCKIDAWQSVLALIEEVEKGVLGE